MVLLSGPVTLQWLNFCMFAGNPLLEKEEPEGPEPLPCSAFLSTHSVWCLAGGPFVCECFREELLNHCELYFWTTYAYACSWSKQSENDSCRLTSVNAEVCEASCFLCGQSQGLCCRTCHSKTFVAKRSKEAVSRLNLDKSALAKTQQLQVAERVRHVVSKPCASLCGNIMWHLDWIQISDMLQCQACHHFQHFQENGSRQWWTWRTSSAIRHVSWLGWHGRIFVKCVCRLAPCLPLTWGEDDWQDEDWCPPKRAILRFWW